MRMLSKNLNLLPRLGSMIDQLQAHAHQMGIETGVPDDGGVRSTVLQTAKFRQGRVQNAAGLWVPIDPVNRTGIVTNAMPEKAPHCAHVDHDDSSGSCACDVAIMDENEFVWNVDDPMYKLYQTLGPLGEALGLVWGGRWGKLADLDHFELPDWRSLPLTSQQLKPTGGSV